MSNTKKFYQERKKLLLFLSIFCVYNILSCGSHGSSESSSQQTPLGSEFIGTYLSGCIYDDGDYVSKKISISEFKSIVTSLIYPDNKCSQEPELRFVGETNLSVIGDYQGATIINKVPNSIKITSYTEEGIASFNTVGLYGKNNWAIGVEQDVTESYMTSLKAQYTNYSIYNTIKLNGNLLYTNEYSPNKNDENPSVIWGYMYVKEGSLNGEYVSECYKEEAGQSFKNKLTITDSQITFASTEYKFEGETVTCNDNDTQKTITTLYNYSFQKSSWKNEEDVYLRPLTISEQLLSYKIKPLNSTVVDTMNTSSFLGKNDWVLNTEKDVTQEFINQTPSGINSFFYARLENNILYTSKPKYLYEITYDDHQYTRIK